KTGQRVPDFPVVTDPSGGPYGKADWIRPDVTDRDRAFDPRTGRNFFRDPADCHWKDGKTGQRVPDFPVITDPSGGPYGEADWIRPDVTDRDRAFDPRTGRNFVRVSCSPSRAATTPPQPPAP